MLCGSHRWYTVVESIRMTSLPLYLTKNEDASMSVGQWAPRNILDPLSTRSHTIHDLRTLASFDQSAPREHAYILHLTSCNCCCFECVRPACVCALCSQLECAFECGISTQNLYSKTTTFTTILTLRTHFVQALALSCLRVD